MKNVVNGNLDGVQGMRILAQDELENVSGGGNFFKDLWSIITGKPKPGTSADDVVKALKVLTKIFG